MDHRPNTSSLLPLDQYDNFIVCFSGGKDSAVLALLLMEMGVPEGRIELWHHDVDGEDKDGLMDWPSTRPYVRAYAEALGLRLLFSWKDGGFEGEMLRQNQRTRGTSYETLSGDVVRLPTKRGKLTTRRKFPQVSADLKVRWCSAYLKIDVSRRVINDDPRFLGKKVLLLTGERRQESTARSKYAEVERHKCSNDKKGRRVDQWRPILDWSEQDVWDAMRRHRIRPHPAYYLGWGRVSCLACIFGNKDQWASVRKISPDRFRRIAQYEQEFGLTIKRDASVVQQADEGQPYHQTDKAPLVAEAMGGPLRPVLVAEGEEWELPAGAFQKCGGPS